MFVLSRDILISGYVNVMSIFALQSRLNFERGWTVAKHLPPHPRLSHTLFHVCVCVCSVYVRMYLCLRQMCLWDTMKIGSKFETMPYNSQLLTACQMWWISEWDCTLPFWPVWCESSMLSYIFLSLAITLALVTPRKMFELKRKLHVVIFNYSQTPKIRKWLLVLCFNICIYACACVARCESIFQVCNMMLADSKYFPKSYMNWSERTNALRLAFNLDSRTIMW